jgi:ribosome-binding factor A
MKRSSGTARDYPRTARLNQLVHEIVAEEIERIDDERLGFFTVVGVEVEPDMRRAVVWYSTLDVGDDDGDANEELAEALEQHRARIQSAIGRQARTKRTPELSFRPDTVIAQAERVEQILRDIGSEGSGGSEGAREGAPGADAEGEGAGAGAAAGGDAAGTGARSDPPGVDPAPGSPGDGG